MQFAFLCAFFLVSNVVSGIPDQSELLGVIRDAASNAERGVKDPVATGSFLGTWLVSQWFVVNRLVGNENATQVKADILREVLLRTQMEDGSWYTVRDANMNTGRIEATVWGYWALKIMGEDLNATHMAKARAWILKRGGVAALNQMHRLFLAILGEFDWSQFKSIPLDIFYPSGLIYVKNLVSQWVYPHLIPMAYLLHFRPVHYLGPLYSVRELYPSKQSLPSASISSSSISSSPKLKVDPIEEHHIKNLVNEMRKIQQPHGSFGTYTLSSILSVIALQDFSRRFPNPTPDVAAMITRGIRYTDDAYSLPGYKGVADYGQYWDSALLGIALGDANVDPASLVPQADAVVAQQQANGGIPFGWDFWYAPDTDDTAETVLFLLHLGDRYSNATRKAIKWLFEMQNTDGGFGAFDKGHTGDGVVGWLVNLLAKQFADSAEIFDPSSVDVTGHVMECWGRAGYDLHNSDGVRKAAAYLQHKQNKDGGLIGRWAINYVYSTSAALCGLAAVKADFSAEWINRAVQFVVKHQNNDGGWGESSLSYVDKAWIGRGISTPTQTAWAVLALMEAAKHPSLTATLEPHIEAAMDYLVKTFEQNHRAWNDPSCVGTGHPGLVYMEYPVYPMSWPLMAASRFYKQHYGPIPSQ